MEITLKEEQVELDKAQASTTELLKVLEDKKSRAEKKGAEVQKTKE